LLYGDNKGDGTWFAGPGSFAGQLGSGSANVAPYLAKRDTSRYLAS
jgi:hypothetical protein